MKRSAIVVVLALACRGAAAFEFDGGGRVGTYLDLVAASDAAGSRVEISGVCASACTLKLGARGSCVHADARLLFHAARDPDGRIDRLGTLMMLQEYPAPIRAWAKRRGALDSRAFTALSGTQAIALGVPACGRR